MSLQLVTQEPIDMAFSIDLIREKIMEHVAWKPNDEDVNVVEEHEAKVLSINEVNSLRLVNRTWLNTITRVLRRERDPLMTIGQLRVADSSVHDFVATMNYNSFYPESLSDDSRMVPPYFLKLYCRFFSQENRQILLDCFQKLGNAMVELKIQFPMDATLSLDNFQSLTFPRLRKLTVDVTEMLINGVETTPPHELVRRGLPVPTKNFQELLQLVLNACREITHLTFFNSEIDEDEEDEPREMFYFPSIFPQMKLPSTLTHLYFQTSIQLPQNLEILLAPQNKLPHLSQLVLYAFERPFESEMVYNILEKLHCSLSHLILDGAIWSEGIPLEGVALEQTHLRFPRMPCLKTLRLLSGRWSLVSGVTHLMGKLPKLETLGLKNCPEDDFYQRWTNNAVYSSVKVMTLSLVGMERLEFARQEVVPQQPENEMEVEEDDMDLIMDDENEFLEDEEGFEAEDELEEDFLDELDEQGNAEEEFLNERNLAEEEQQAITGRNGMDDDGGMTDTDSDEDTDEDDFEEDEDDIVYIVLPRNSQTFPVLPVTPERIQRVRTAFPNLTKLSLSTGISPESVAGFASLYTSLPNLSSLDIRTSDNPPSELYWDAVITGLSENRVAQLRKVLDSLKDARLELSEDDVKAMMGSRAAENETPSICKMTKLNALLLACRPERRDDATTISVISGLVFYLAFFRMPQLNKLELAGGFKPSEEMTLQWRNMHGGAATSITYFPRTC